MTCVYARGRAFLIRRARALLPGNSKDEARLWSTTSRRRAIMINNQQRIVRSGNYRPRNNERVIIGMKFARSSRHRRRRAAILFMTRIHCRSLVPTTQIIPGGDENKIWLVRLSSDNRDTSRVTRYEQIRVSLCITVRLSSTKNHQVSKILKTKKLKKNLNEFETATVIQTCTYKSLYINCYNENNPFFSLSDVYERSLKTIVWRLEVVSISIPRFPPNTRKGLVCTFGVFVEHALSGVTREWLLTIGIVPTRYKT